MSYLKIAVLTFVGALVALIGFAFYPSTTALAQGVRQNQPNARDRDEAAEKLREPRYPIDAWTPRPPLEMQYAPKARVLDLSTTVWTSIGPTPLSNTTPADPNFNVSGRITAVAAHPTDSNTIYVATAGGGVWKTTNGGTTWTPLTDTQVTLSMGAIAVARSNPQIIYAGTGEANNSLDSNCGRGILVSSDGGTTWTLRTGPGNFFSVNRMATSKIVVDPGNALVAYAAMSGAATNGNFINGITGVYKTIDGGVNWSNVTAINGKDSLFPWSDAAVDPNTTSTLYGAVGYIFGTANNAGYKSIDTGGTWNVLNAANAPVGASFGRISLAISKAANGNVLYVAAEDNTSSGGALSRFVRSDNGGGAFTNLTAGTPNYVGGQGWYDQTLIVDPTNSAIVYAAGSAGANSILRSINSGANWTGIANGGAPNFTTPHPDHHGADFDASGRYLDGNDGGLYRLDNPATPSWSDLNGNLCTIQFQGVGLHPTNPNIVIGGSQDNGTELYTGNIAWLLTDGGDGGFAKFSSTNGNRAYHQIPNGSFGTNFFRRSDNGGNTWVTKTATISADVNVQNFYAPFSVDPTNGDRVLYGTNRVWETTNAGDAWAPISNSGSNGFTNGGNFVDTIGIAKTDTNTVYAATSGAFGSTSQIFVTTNHGANWTEHDLPAGNGRVNEIQVDPTNSQLAYAVVNRFGGGHVFRTTNGGAIWNNISGNLANIPVWSIQINPSTVPATLYIGAEDGVYVSTDTGTTWTRFGTGLPNAQCFQIELSNSLNILLVGTHGRGAWEISTGAAAPGGALCTEFFERFDKVVAPALPAGWMATNVAGPAPLWVTSTSAPNSSPNSAVVDDPAVSSDKVLDTPGIFISSPSVRVFFSHSFNLERDTDNFYDGAVLEVSSPNINGGAFTDVTNAAVGGSFVSGGYNATISNCCGNALAGRMAWGGNSGGYVSVVADPGPNVVGQTIKLRFRMASDSSVAAIGWSVDGFVVQDFACPLQTAVSSKVHGGAGTFNINLPFDATNLLTGIGIEDRTAGGSYQILANFSGPVTIGSVSVTSGTGAATFGTAGATCTVNLTGVTNAQRLGVTLSNVTVGARNGDITIPMGVLIGDTSGNGSVNAGDVSQTKTQSGAIVGAGNFRQDVTVNGSINASDVNAVKTNSGTALPP